MVVIHRFVRHVGAGWNGHHAVKNEAYIFPWGAGLEQPLVFVYLLDLNL